MKLTEFVRSSERLSIVGLGDSLTQGWMVRRGFFDRFVDGLDVRFPEVDIRRLNAGIPGDTAGGGLLRAPRVVEPAPCLVVVEFAVNDYFVGVPLERFEGEIRSILELLREAGCATLPVTSCPLAYDEDQRGITPYYDAVRGLAEQMELPLADIDRFWRARSPVAPLLLDDGVHPSDEGHRLMAEALLELFPRD